MAKLISVLFREVSSVLFFAEEKVLFASCMSVHFLIISREILVDSCQQTSLTQFSLHKRKSCGKLKQYLFLLVTTVYIDYMWFIIAVCGLGARLDI